METFYDGFHENNQAAIGAVEVKWIMEDYDVVIERVYDMIRSLRSMLVRKLMTWRWMGFINGLQQFKLSAMIGIRGGSRGWPRSKI
ncbi:hypothetical protein FJQ98_11970 [Lysinibacillus agricola]|uniref:Uncharacterized protein n=1 Tax=Lysinibacillus agricola TaxID=2590012 RepID=A0ABX7AXW4_9BACI|nr:MULTISPECIES: hypothetical protein [Lysinibacillus]KOS60349.1 hypothetical protein AN161_25055 [Lysinibacillus sp. FJAT-14222]QQP14651.1 hypothetical protein FJQ98_11970 [Lysinibacillus agricola]